MPLELVAVIVLALVALVWLTVRQQNLRLRQMQHRERLARIDSAAIENQPMPREGDPEMPDTLTRPRDPATYMHWFRLITLGMAFLLTFGGVGLLTSFIISDDPEIERMWSLGLTPIMTGTGLFLFWIMLTRRKDG